MRTFVLVCSLVACNSPPPINAGISALALPMPVMLGPVRCIGVCGPEPRYFLRYGVDARSTIGSRNISSDSSTSTVGAWKTTTTTTDTVVQRAGVTLFSYPLLLPLLLGFPLSPRAVVQLTSIEIATQHDVVRRANMYVDTTTDDTTLAAIAMGQVYVVPPAQPVPTIKNKKGK